MMGPTTLKEIRVQLCHRLGIADEELDAWMRRTVPQRRLSRELNEAELQSLLQELEDAATKKKKRPSRPTRNRSRVSVRQQRPKAREFSRVSGRGLGIPAHRARKKIKITSPIWIKKRKRSKRKSKSRTLCRRNPSFAGD